MIRVYLPQPLRIVARLKDEISLHVEPPVTQRSVLNELELRYPALAGTIRDHVTQERRPYIRFFANSEDLSHESPDALLPDSVIAGTEPLLIIGAIAGGSFPLPLQTALPMAANLQPIAPIPDC